MPEAARHDAQPPLLLGVPDGTQLPAALVELRYVAPADDAAAEVRAAFELEPAAYATVARDHLLHLDPDVRGAGAERFAPSGAVRIEARLAAHLSAELLAQAPDATAAGDLLAALSRDAPSSPLLDADAWFALSVTEAVELAPGLAAEGSLRRGYTTTWAAPPAGDALEFPEPDTAGGGPADDEEASGAAVATGRRLELPMLLIAAAVLDEHGWSYEDMEADDALGWRMRSPRGSWTSFAVAREAERRFAVYSVLDCVVAPPLRSDAAELVTRANWGLPVGAWELDMDDGTLRLRTSIDVAGDRLSIDLATALIERNLAVTEERVAGFTSFAEAGVTVAEALASRDLGR